MTPLTGGVQKVRFVHTKNTIGVATVAGGGELWRYRLVSLDFPLYSKAFLKNLRSNIAPVMYYVIQNYILRETY